MNFNEYQKTAYSFSRYPQGNLVYPTLGLAGESGEFADKIKKVMRDHDGVIDEDTRRALALELGDVLWYLSCLADRLAYKLSEIAEMNIDKLASRKARGVLGGSGDNR